MEKEFRSHLQDINLEKDDMLISGYAVVFNSEAVLFTDDKGNQYKEVITRDALKNCDLSDVILRYNHKDTASLLARTSNDTLQLSTDDTGLYFVASIANTNTGRDIYELVKRGDLNKMSFGFTVESDYIQNRTRYITAIKNIFELSLVDFPAYQSTYVEAVKRDFYAAEEEMQAAIANIATLRKKVELLSL